MSKGSWKRPVFVDHQTYSDNFERTFGKKKPKVDKDIKEGRAINLTLKVGDEDDGTSPEEVR